MSKSWFWVSHALKRPCHSDLMTWCGFPTCWDEAKNRRIPDKIPCQSDGYLHCWSDAEGLASDPRWLVWPQSCQPSCGMSALPADGQISGWVADVHSWILALWEALGSGETHSDHYMKWIRSTTCLKEIICSNYKPDFNFAFFIIHYQGWVKSNIYVSLFLREKLF